MDFFQVKMYQEYDNVSRLKFYMSKNQLKSNITASMGLPQYVDVVINFFFFSEKEDFWEKSLNSFWKDAGFDAVHFYAPDGHHVKLRNRVS